MRPLFDRAFQSTFARLFVYNILFEDSEVDEQYLDIDEGSTVLSITGAGCGVAGMVSRRPRRIDAVDINAHHLALTALKVTAAQRMESYQSFYDLFGRGWQADPRATILPLLRTLPDWMQKHWRSRTNLFERSIYHEGLTSQMLGQLRKMTGVDARWMRWVMGLSTEQRKQAIDEWIAPVLAKPYVRAMLSSPVQLVALGINFTQRDSLVATEGLEISDYFVEHLKRLAETNLETNWFAWFGTAGHFNHDHPEAVPPYLRRDRHARSLGAPTVVHYHRRNLFDVLEGAGPRSYSHYTLCDAPDWMPPATQRRLLDEILRTSRDGAIVLARSVEGEGLVEKHGLEKRIVPMVEASDLASQNDRSRQYRRVNFYQVQH